MELLLAVCTPNDQKLDSGKSWKRGKSWRTYTNRLHEDRGSESRKLVALLRYIFCFLLLTILGPVPARASISITSPHQVAAPGADLDHVEELC